MKKSLLISLLLLACLSPAFPARQGGRVTLTGRIVDTAGAPVDYATVVLLGADSLQKAGVASDDQGRFSLVAPRGRYTLRVQYLGYQPHTMPLEAMGDRELGEIVLHPSTVAVGEVVVTARLITRESDRFVVDVANNPASAIGKDGVEMLSAAPGVWINDDKISINGNSGTRVMVNERLLTQTGDDLIAYLRTINAEDIQRIEVIPVSGADYDADSAGGIVKITLKKRRQDGIAGSVQFYGNANSWGHYLAPRASIDYHGGRLNLYASGGYSRYELDAITTEHTEYTSQADNTLTGLSRLGENGNSYNGRLGMVYDLTQRSSVGVEGNVSFSDSHQNTSSSSLLKASQRSTRNTSLYEGGDSRDYWSLTANWIARLDTLGSTFKLIGDFTSRTSEEGTDYWNRAETAGAVRDSTYRSDLGSDYRIYALTAALEKKFSATTTLRTGAKYTRNRMDNSTLYRGLDAAGEWVIDRNQSVEIDYTENIGALYGIFSAKIGRMGLTAGLRAEYTHAAPRSEQQVQSGTQSTYARQSYLSLFPNANLSFALNQKQSASLIVSYARTIRRPSFWSLSPRRVQLSEYAYITGNPRLKPSFNNTFTLTSVVGYKYTFTLGASLVSDDIQQLAQTSTDGNSNVLMYRWENMDSQWSFYLSANLPFTLAKWCTLSVNATGMRLDQRIAAGSAREVDYMVQGYTQLNTTLPRGFYFEASHWFHTSVQAGNLRVKGQQSLSLMLKKSFAKDRFTLKAGVENLLGRSQRVIAEQSDFIRHTAIKGSQGGLSPRFAFSLRYNFHGGVKFRARNVESGAADEKRRMGQ